MAEATLNDVISRLRDNNARQLEEQRSTTVAIEGLNSRITALLVLMELEALKKKEADAEAKRDRSAAKSKASSGRDEGLGLGSMFSGLGGPLAMIASAVGGIASFATGFALATEGLGPSLEQFRNFTTRLARIFMFPVRFITAIGRSFGGRSIAEFISRQIAKIDDLFTRRFTFDPRAGAYRNLQTGRFGQPGAIQRILAQLNRLFGQISRIFSAIRIPNRLISDISRLNSGLLSALGIRSGAVGSIMNSGLVRGIFRFLRPIAAIFSIFDGIRNAADEMEDREGLFNKYLGGGIGGFISGAFGSFFGEFANFLRDIPLWVIRQFVPAEWLNADGTFKDTGEGGNWFTSMLAGIENIDFNGLITRIFQYPFNVVANALDFVRNLFGAAGTTEEGQTEARAAWNSWWGNFSSVGGTLSNIGDVFSYLANIVFFPLNAIFHEIETAFFGADPNRGEETFSERIGRYLSNIRTYLFQWLADLIGPGRLATFLGLDQYLQSDANQNERLSDAGQRLRGLQAQYADIMAQFDTNGNGVIDPNEDMENIAGGLLSTLTQEANQARDDYQEALAGLRSNGTTAATTINNYQSAVDNWNISMPPTTDGNDPLLPSAAN